MDHSAVMIDGRLYAVRLPTGGAYHGAASEWDDMLDILGEKNPALHSKNLLSWCQDTAQNHPECRVYRGQLSPRHWNNTYSYRNYPHVGFRPVLEPLDPVTLQTASAQIQHIPDGTVLTMGSFLVNGVSRYLPQDPFWCGDVPEYRDHMHLAIGDTDSDPPKQLRFIKCKNLLWCDRNLMTNIPWDALASFGLVYGCSAPSKDATCALIQPMGSSTLQASESCSSIRSKTQHTHTLDSRER